MMKFVASSPSFSRGQIGGTLRGVPETIPETLSKPRSRSVENIHRLKDVSDFVKLQEKAPDILHSNETIESILRLLKQKPKVTQPQGESVAEGRHSVSFYMTQLERHLDPQLLRNPSKKLLKGLYTIESLLTSLEVDLRSNPNATWLREFIDEPNSGHVVLLKMLKHIHERTNYINSTISNGKLRKLDAVLSKEPNDEHLCVLCIKAIVRNKYGFLKILSAPRSLATMAWSLRLSNTKTKIAVLKIFSEACEHPGGFDKTLQALEDYKQTKQEQHRFQCLVHSVIYNNGRQNNLSYIECVVRFFNTLLANAPSLNQRVFHQQEVELAGFTAEKVEICLEGLRAESVREELNIWRDNYIDVATTLDEFVALKGRSGLLRDEVDFLQTKLEEVGRDKSKLYIEKKQLEKRLDDYKLRASEIHGQIENIKRQNPDSNDNEEISNVLEIAVEEILRPVSPIASPRPSLKRESGMEEAPISSLSPPPPPPIPPPPLIGGGGSTCPVDSPFPTSSARLPLLHWQPVHQPSERSIFTECHKDADDITSKLDFSEFDTMFELKQIESHRSSTKAALQKISDQITVLNSNKARNLLIARKRISLSPDELKSAIDTCDIVSLSPECAELLLQFTPTNEERISLHRCSDDYDNLADAEKFLYQLLQIERLESRLNTIAFMGVFDDLFRTVSPQVEAIITGCITIATSQKLKQLITIILAYGNYINGSRRGITQAFKLESLSKLEEIKTNDKKTNLLQYLVEVIRAKFPDIHEFHEEIEVQPALNISMETLASDVQHLRKGLDAAKSERDKQPDNYAIHNFYSRAVLKVQQVSERYRKMEEQFREVCTLFCENPKSTEPSKLFSVIHKFIDRYKCATKEIDIRKQAEQTLYKAEQLKLNQGKLRTKSSSIAEGEYSIEQNNTSTLSNSCKLRLIHANSVENLLDETAPMSRSYTDSKLCSLNELSRSADDLDTVDGRNGHITNRHGGKSGNGHRFFKKRLSNL